MVVFLSTTEKHLEREDKEAPNPGRFWRAGSFDALEGVDVLMAS